MNTINLIDISITFSFYIHAKDNFYVSLDKNKTVIAKRVHTFIIENVFYISDMLTC